MIEQSATSQGLQNKITQPSKRKLREISSDSIKRAKKKRKPGRKAVEEDEIFDVELGLNAAIGRLNNQLLADFIAQKIKKADPDLSIVELEELRIPCMFVMYRTAYSSSADAIVSKCDSRYK